MDAYLQEVLTALGQKIFEYRTTVEAQTAKIHQLEDKIAELDRLLNPGPNTAEVWTKDLADAMITAIGGDVLREEAERHEREDQQP